MEPNTSGPKIVALPERLTEETIDSIDRQISDSEIMQQDYIVLDASQSRYINSFAIGFLVNKHKYLKSIGKDLSISNISGYVFKIFQHAGLLKLFVREKKKGIFGDSTAPSAPDLDVGIDYELVDGIGVFHLSGAMVHPNGPSRFKDYAFIAMAETKKFLLEMNNLSYFDSPTVGEMIMINALLKTSKGGIRACNLNEIVRDLFDTLQLHQIITTYPTMEEAIKAWK